MSNLRILPTLYQNHIFKFLILITIAIALNIYFISEFPFSKFDTNIEVDSPVTDKQRSDNNIIKHKISLLNPKNTKEERIDKSLVYTNNITKYERIGFLHVGKAGGSTASNMLMVGCVGASPSLQSFTLNTLKSLGFKASKDKNITKVSNETLHKLNFKGITSLSNVPTQIHLLLNDKTFQTHQSTICKAQAKKASSRFNPKTFQTPVSQYTTGYFHIRKPNIQNFDSFIVTIRHPIDRFVSWFLFSHIQNRAVKPWRDARHFYNCYREVDEVASIGLSELDVGKMDECQKYAYHCMIGEDYSCEHMFFNYQFYVGDILETNKDIFVVRTKQFYDDWDNINKLLMQEHNISGSIPNIRMKEVTYRGSKYQNTVSNKTISPIGMENLCRVLCEEIQLYKRLVKRALNLDEVEKGVSFQELSRSCPIQTVRDTC